MSKDNMGASLRDRAVVNGAASVSALRTSVPSAVEFLHTSGQIDDRLYGAATALEQAHSAGAAEPYLSIAGHGLRDILWRVVCQGENIATAERALGWPARSGRLVLRLALDRIATAQGIEAGTATTGTGVVHESPVGGNADAPEPSQPTPRASMENET